MANQTTAAAPMMAINATYPQYDTPSCYSFNQTQPQPQAATTCPPPTATQSASHRRTSTKTGSRRIFTPEFKQQVLDAYYNDEDCKGNQRATSRKYGIHRRQVQKWHKKVEDEAAAKGVQIKSPSCSSSNSSSINNKKLNTPLKSVLKKKTTVTSTTISIPVEASPATSDSAVIAPTCLPTAQPSQSFVMPPHPYLYHQFQMQLQEKQQKHQQYESEQSSSSVPLFAPYSPTIGSRSQPTPTTDSMNGAIDLSLPKCSSPVDLGAKRKFDAIAVAPDAPKVKLFKPYLMLDDNADELEVTTDTDSGTDSTTDAGNCIKPLAYHQRQPIILSSNYPNHLDIRPVNQHFYSSGFNGPFFPSSTVSPTPSSATESSSSSSSNDFRSISPIVKMESRAFHRPSLGSPVSGYETTTTASSLYSPRGSDCADDARSRCSSVDEILDVGDSYTASASVVTSSHSPCSFNMLPPPPPHLLAQIDLAAAVSHIYPINAQPLVDGAAWMQGQAGCRWRY